ncbi:hypothetical protein HDC92_001671, partial [Pedobacter sp. AK017]|nr:hypothetical protein [Pedobacter sp. AK017]
MLNTLRSNVLSCYRGICCLVFLLCSLFNLSNVLAEGSKDLYPVGASGNRAFLYSNAALGIISTSVAFPFRTLGTHYVYAVKNEYIAVASSAQGVGNGIIIITSPSGVQTMTTVGSTVGKISSRTEELAGPRFPGEGAGNNRYLPYSFQVGNDEGVWKIEFIPTGNKVDTNSPTASDVFADGTWSQSNNTPLISAWDVSVCNAVKDKWLRGRVYTNVLNLKLSQNFDDSNKAYNGINYVLTKDGRAYRVKNNGNNGLGFTFFSNNKGFVDATGNPLYKSLNTTDETVIANAVHDPRAVDDLTKNLVTHKLFYGPPSPDLPVSAKVAIDGTTSTTTWLKNEPTVPVVSNIDFVGSEGTVGQASQKGGTIIFKTNVAGSYRITIPLGAGKDRVLNGAAANGVNTIKWDGKDGLGNLVPGGLVVPEVRVRLASAEVHFPFIDMEINPKGIIIELTENSAFYPVNPTPNIIDESVYSDRVYWDDSDITGGKAGEVSNPQVNVINGISSNSNGHKWGSYSGSSGSGNSGTGTNSYGNEKAMDTYAYILSKEEAQPLNVNVKVADLQVVSVIPTYTSTAAGTQVTYAVKVKNAGVSDVTGAAFHFNVPTGFTVNANGIISSFTGATGAESNAVLDATGFSSMLDLANGCIVTYTINGTIGAGISGNDILVDASIMRPKDVTDPDATNIIFDKAPTNPHDECLNGTANEVCNNIKYNTAHAQLVCVNSSIVPIEYVLEAGGTDVQILPELPAGLVKNITGGKLTITGTPTASGVFTFTINTLGTQRSTKTVVLTVGSRAIASDIEVADKAICIGQSAELTSNLAAGSTIVNPVFNWYSEAALTTLLHTGTIYTVNPTVSTTYYVTVKGDNSCENASGAGKAVTITVNPLPLQPTVTASGGTTFCVGGSVVLTSNAATSYQWYRGTTLLTGETNQTYTASESGNYTVIVTDGNSCSSPASAAVPVTVNPLPLQPTVTASAGTTFCLGGSVVLTSSAATSYQWYRGTTLLTGETNQTYTASESGNYTVIITDGNSCSSPASTAVTVTVNPLPLQPTVTASAGTTFCLGGSVTLTSSVAASYQWYRGTTLLTGETNQTYTASESGNYTVIVTDGNSCSSPASTAVTVTVNPLPLQPTVTASAGTTFCLGGSVTLTSSAAASYQWYRGTTLLTGETNQTYRATVTGNYTVVVTDGNSCSSPASAAVTVTVNPLPLQPTVTASAGTTFCLGGSVTLTSSAAASYQWYRGTTLLTGETNQTYRATVTGNYTVVVTDGNSCSSPASAAVPVTVNPLPLQPTVTASGGTTFCLGGSVTLTSSAAASYQWYRGTTLLTGETNQTYTASESGNYTVIVTDGNSCSSPASTAVTVTVNPLPLQPTVTASAGTTFCLGGSVTLTSSAAASYQWYRGTTLLTGETNQTYTASESGNYTVVVTDGNSCSSPASAAVPVTVNPLPLQPTVTASAGTTFCLGGSVTLTSSAAASYQWYRGTTLLTGETNQTYTASESGNYTVIVTDGNSCSSPASAAVPVTVNPLPLQPTVTASGGTTFCVGGSVVLTSSAATSYQWYRGTTLLTGETNQTYTASESGNYTVVVTDGNSCSSPASTAVPVTVNPLPLQPTVTASAGTTFCLGGSVTLTSSVAASYQWYRGTTLLTG